jgi:hypothetical protein
MTERLLSACCLLALLLGVSGCRTTGAVVDTPEGGDPLPYALRDADGGFSVRLPGAPETEEDSIPTDHGPMRAVTWSFTAETAVYMVTYNEFPTGVLVHGTPEQQLAGARDGSIASTGGELVEEKPIVLAGHPGLEMAVRVNGGAYRARLFLAGSRLYQILVAAEDEGVFSDVATAFLESFSFDGASSPGS